MMPEWSPRGGDVLLLRAAVGDAEAARAAWDEWRAGHRFEDVSGEMYWLLPPVYRNLRRLGVAERDGLDARFAGLYKRAWFKNRLAFHHAARVVGALEARGLPTLLLKGAALAIAHYKDAGARAMEDVDVLVPAADRGRAIAVLGELGFRPGSRGAPIDATEDYLSLHHSCPFHDAGGHEVDLHWYLSSYARVPGIDDAMWAASARIEIEGVATRALGPTDQLFHVVAHGYASATPHVRWLADAATVLAGSSVDWDRLVGHARARRMVLPVRAALEQLRDLARVPVPPSVLAALTATRVSIVDRLEHAHDGSTRPFTVGKVLLRLWCTHRRGSAPGASLVAGFPDFLRRYYGLARTRDLVGRPLWRGVRRIWNAGLY